MKNPLMLTWIRRLLILLLLLTPMLVSVILLQVARGLWLTDAFPFWSDEIWYWHQAKSFAAVGFNSGFYNVKEIPAPLALSPFNSWGMFIPMFYGSFAKIFGWTLNSMVILNLALLTAAIAVLIRAMRPTIEQFIMLIVLFATYSPLWLYSFTSMTVVMQLGIGTLLASGFIILLQKRENTPRVVWMALAIGIALIGLERLTWTVFYLPLVLLLAPKITGKRWLVALFITGIAFLLATAAAILTGGHYPNFFGDVVAAFRSDIPHAFELIWQNLSTNIGLLDKGEGYEIAYRPRLAMLTGLVAILGAWFWFKRDSEKVNASGMILYLLATFSLITVVIYDVKLSRDFRLFAPIILFALLISVAYRWRVVLIPILISFVLMLSTTWDVYQIWTEWHIDPIGREAYYAWGAEFEKVIYYESDAPNRWCNTLLHSHLYLWTQTSIVMSMPAGIGLSTTFEQADMPPPYQARWLMFTDEEFATWGEGLDVTPILEVPFGKLYRNNESACPD